MARARFAGAFAGLWWLATCLAVSTPAAQAPPAPGEFRPPAAPEQPIPFSHRAHLAQGLECADCHKSAATEDHATLPPTATCMTCHSGAKTASAAIETLRAIDARHEDVPWKRVYRIPTYVYFSHSVHVTADKSITCETCHGNVRDMDVMQKVKDTSMAACTECHTQHKAAILCDSCHEARG